MASIMKELELVKSEEEPFKPKLRMPGEGVL
jgi:hypothetical protein